MSAAPDASATFDRLAGAVERLQWQHEAMLVLIGDGELELAANLVYATADIARQVKALVRQMADEVAPGG